MSPINVKVVDGDIIIERPQPFVGSTGGAAASVVPLGFSINVTDHLRRLLRELVSDEVRKALKDMQHDDL